MAPKPTEVTRPLDKVGNPAIISERSFCPEAIHHYIRYEGGFVDYGNGGDGTNHWSAEIIFTTAHRKSKLQFFLLLIA